MRVRNSTSASSEIRGVASVRRRSQIPGLNIHSGMANCKPSGNLTITIGASPQIPNPFNFYSVTWVIAVADLGGIQTMSSTKTPYDTLLRFTCWNKASTSAPFSCYSVIAAWPQPQNISA